jgi:hypothetical protein
MMMIIMIKEFKKKHDYDEGIQIKTMIMIRNPNKTQGTYFLTYLCLDIDA